MKFLFDESVELRLSHSLKAQGHDVKTIITDYASSIEDAEVLKIAWSEQRILITNDKDFGELVFLYHHPHTGVILLRLKRENGYLTGILWLLITSPLREGYNLP